jgi:hypothetical protein
VGIIPQEAAMGEVGLFEKNMQKKLFIYTILKS